MAQKARLFRRSADHGPESQIRKAASDDAAFLLLYIQRLDLFPEQPAEQHQRDQQADHLRKGEGPPNEVHIARKAQKPCSRQKHQQLAAIGIAVSGFFQALGRSTYSALASLCRQLVVLLPAAWLLSLAGNVDLVWWSFPISEVVSLLISLVLFRRLFRERSSLCMRSNKKAASFDAAFLI